MGFFNKLLTAIRSGSRELEKAVLNNQGLRNYEQEIENAKNTIKEAESDLPGVMAMVMQIGREMYRLKQEINKHEEQALTALEQGNEDLADKVANHIVELEKELEKQYSIKKEYSAHVNSINEKIKLTQAMISAHEREIAMTKTADKIHKAAKSISQHMDSESENFLSAKESLQRIKLRLQNETDRIAALEALNAELISQSLDAKLNAAGIGDDANRKKLILDRLKATQQGSTF